MKPAGKFSNSSRILKVQLGREGVRRLGRPYRSLISSSYVLGKLSTSRKRQYRGQIPEHIFAPNGDHCYKDGLKVAGIQCDGPAGHRCFVLVFECVLILSDS